MNSLKKEQKLRLLHPWYGDIESHLGRHAVRVLQIVDNPKHGLPNFRAGMANEKPRSNGAIQVVILQLGQEDLIVQAKLLRLLRAEQDFVDGNEIFGVSANRTVDLELGNVSRR